METNKKPLGKKSYGSIPHLIGSRLGEGDHHCHEGQHKIATEKTRDRHDLVIVQEKLDGSNVGVAKIDGKIIAITRAGYTADSSKYFQHIVFDKWVKQNESRFFNMLKEGERVCGEWLAQAHGTKYNLSHEPFVPFDFMVGNERTVYSEFEKRVKEFDFTVPNLLHVGRSIGIEYILEKIKTSGHGAIDEVEGAIWRVERQGKVDFLAKFVHHFKQDGKYLPEMNGGETHWNIDITPYTELTINL